MSREDTEGKGSFSTDHRLADIYEAALNEDDDVLESVCPAFVQLEEAEDRYEKETFIGEGGLKSVYKVFDRRTQRWVAMAKLRKDRRLQFYDIFVREAWLISSLSHPNIIKVHDAGVDEEGRPFFTMDLRGNRSLAELLNEAESGNLQELLDIFLKVCDAVAYAHSKGIVHLDLKPENIQCEEFGEVLVCDWGLGRRLENSSEELEMEVFPLKSVRNSTLLGKIKGSPGYMAPEQTNPNMTKDEKTDIYALGCLLHTILCGEPPFTGTTEEVLQKTAGSKVPSLRDRFNARNVPPSLEAVVLKATRRRPANRYDSVLSLRQDIRNYLSGFATKAEEPGFLREAALFVNRNRMPVSITVVAIFVLSALSVLFIQQLGKEQLATQEERQRADELLSEVNLISSEYESLFEEQALTKQELAEQVARSASNLRNLAFFERPVATLEQSERLIQMALELDPTHEYSQQQLYTIYSLQMNYLSASSDPLVLNRGRNFGFTRLVDAFSAFDYDLINRPKPEDMVGFLTQAFEITPRITGYIERVFALHVDVVGNREGFDRELEAFVQFHNGGPGKLRFHYDKISASLKIHYMDDAAPLNLKGRTSALCLLRYIPIRTLTIESQAPVELSHLMGLDIESLDISACRQSTLEAQLNLPHLQQIVMQRGQIDSGSFRQHLRSNDPVEVVEVDSGR